MKLLITGGCGFIGSNYIRMTLKNYPDDDVVNLDALTYAGNPDNLADLASNKRYTFVRGDIADAQFVDALFAEHKFTAVINFAAESHVDRSIQDAAAFLQTNVLGTQSLLNACVRHKPQRFLQVSTDEVYGSLGPLGRFTEDTPIAPRSPYSASKASADHLVLAAYHTHGLNTVITRCSNNYGPYQFPEKLIPLMILNAFQWKELPVYGDGLHVRDWIHVEDHCRAIENVLAYGNTGHVYNIGGGNELPNLELVKMILKLMERPNSLIKHVEDRLGHDRRYSIDCTKIRRELGWQPEKDFQDGIRETVKWYLENSWWWQKIVTGEYRNYYHDMYGTRGIHEATTRHEEDDRERL